jgi:peptidyl-prolyl cis-trans isomerase D
MIRFLQTDNRLTKALLVVVIGAASVSMVVYLIPGLTQGADASPDTYAVVYPHWYSRFLASGDTVTQTEVQRVTQQQLAARGPQYANNPMIVSLFEQQVGTQLVQQKVLLEEAARLGIKASSDDVINYLRTGENGAVLFPDGKFIGKDAYAQLISDRLNMSVTQFEDGIKEDIVLRRLEALVSDGVTVSPQEVRETYRKQNIKIKFDYAVISSDDVLKSINPSDSDLEGFFKKNAARYNDAVPEQRSISYFAFNTNDLPGGIPQPSAQQVQAYYTQHQADFQQAEQARARHILVSVAANADEKTLAAARAKAEGILKQLKGGAKWDDVAKASSDDPGSKNSGGELGWAKRGQMVPEFDNAIFTQQINAIELVKSQFGFHVVQVEERQQAHTQALSEVQAQIQAALMSQAVSTAQQSYAAALTAEAVKNGLAKTAAAHKLQVVTTPLLARAGTISAVADSSQLLAKAFASKQGDPPQSASTGEGYAIFQVAGIQAAHAPAFADWKSHVLDDYRQEQLPTILAAKTKALDDQAKNLNDLAKAAKAAGAKFETSQLVGQSEQVPDLGAVGQIAPELFDLNVGTVSGPINAERTGVVARIVDKQEPSADEIQKNFDQTRDQLLAQRRQEAFGVFLSNAINTYQKSKRIVLAAKPKTAQLPGM